MSHSYRLNDYTLIILSGFVALLFQIMPWPKDFYMFKPVWLELFVIYWVLVLSHKFNIGAAFLFGLLWDLVVGATLGTHALVLSILAYCIAYKEQLVRTMSLWQQSLVVILASFIALVFNTIVDILTRHTALQSEVLWQCLINGILWPWFFLLMQKIRSVSVLN